METLEQHHQLLNVQTPFAATDLMETTNIDLAATAETLLTHTMHTTTLLAGTDKLLDACHVQEDCYSTRNGTHVCTKDFTKQDQVIKAF